MKKRLVVIPLAFLLMGGAGCNNSSTQVLPTEALSVDISSSPTAPAITPTFFLTTTPSTTSLETSIKALIKVEKQGINFKGPAVYISQVVSPVDGWVVIHIVVNGQPGDIIGYVPVKAGTASNVKVPITDTSKITPTLIAMLHGDLGVKGTYEFPGSDVPLKDQGQVVMTEFEVFNGTLNTPVAPQPTSTSQNDKNDMNTKVDQAGHTSPSDRLATKVVELTAKQWNFSPSTIEVQKGQMVHLIIKSVDGTHGFYLPDFDISKTLTPNQPVIVDFKADKAGTFTFSCNLFCGEGHTGMKGTLIVK